MKKILFIVGPTAIGKTKLAFTIASSLSGILVNADSVQVYKELNIISGKDLPNNSKFVDEANNFKSLGTRYQIGYFTLNNSHIYLLDLVDPSYNFSVYDFLQVSTSVIHNIQRSGKLPIVVGGTGFYVKALLDGIETLEVAPNEKLREELINFKVEELQSILTKESPGKFESMNNSDINNKRRLIRAVEVVRYYKNKHQTTQKLENFDNLIIGLTASKAVIKKRIDDRVERRIEMGALDEARILFTRYNNLSSQVKVSNGYKQLFEHFLGKYSLNEAIKKWRLAEYLNAKKQMTWFKKDKGVQWFDITKRGFGQKIKFLVREWLEKK